MLVWLLVALYVLRAGLTYALFDSLVDDYVERRPHVPREMAPDLMPQYRVLALVTAVVIGGALAAAAVFLPRGAGWSRIVATVFGVLGLLGGLIGLLQPGTAPFKLFGLVLAVVALAAVVLLWLPASSAFFRRGAARG